MNLQRLREITDRYGRLSIALLGDFCLDRYLEIDPARQETSLETGLAVYNVTGVRAQPGAAGTVLNNLVALGVGTIIPLGFAGDDGEGFELCRALRAMPRRALRFVLADAAAADVHLLQAVDRRAGEAASRTKPPGQQELDAHAGGGRRPIDRSPAAAREADRRAGDHGSGRSGRHRRAHSARAGRGGRDCRETVPSCASWPTAAAVCAAIRRSR